jgi:hypothetical protein
MLQKAALQDLYYSKRLSMFDLAGSLGVTPATVVYWMKKYDLGRRSNSESAYVKQNPMGDPFRIKNRLSKQARDLLIAALMLYWAEGSRKNKYVIQIANLDARLLALFIRFLRTICGVKENKICLTVQLYKEYDKEETRDYWAIELGIPQKYITVGIHSDIRSKPEKLWSKYGIARIEVRNVKLKHWLDETLEAYLKKLAL